MDNKKVNVDIPLEIIYNMINKFGLSFDEAIKTIVNGTVKIITPEIKEKYEKWLKEKN